MMNTFPEMCAVEIVLQSDPNKFHRRQLEVILRVINQADSNFYPYTHHALKQDPERLDASSQQRVFAVLFLYIVGISISVDGKCVSFCWV
jgi:hypothetical protein